MSSGSLGGGWALDDGLEELIDLGSHDGVIDMASIEHFLQMPLDAAEVAAAVADAGDRGETIGDEILKARMAQMAAAHGLAKPRAQQQMPRQQLQVQQQRAPPARGT